MLKLTIEFQTEFNKILKDNTMMHVNITFSFNKSKTSLQTVIFYFFIVNKINGIQTSQQETIRNTLTIKTSLHSPQLKGDIVLNVQTICL